MQGTGENQRRTKRVRPTQAGREKQGAGRRTHGVGEHLLQDLGYLKLEEMGAGERQLASVPVALPKVGGPSLRMDPVAVMGEGTRALGLDQAQ